MSNLLHIIAPLSATLAETLVAALWQGTLIVLLTLVGLRLFPAISAAARSIVWLAALLLLALLNVLPLLRIHSAGAVVGHAALNARVLHVDPRWSIALATVWMLLSLARAAQLLRSAAALHNLSHCAEPLSINAIPSALLRHHEGRQVQVCASTDVDRPSVVGFFAPKILLPVDLVETLSPATLEPVLRHEMEHLRRRDDWTNLLQKLALVLFPLSPALLWVERRLCEERELACDDGVLRATGARKAYASSLATLAEHSLLSKGLTLALGAWDRRTALEHRIRRILYQPTKHMSAPMTTAAVFVLVLGAIGSSCVVARAPQIVSFTPATPVSRVVTAQITTPQVIHALPAPAQLATTQLPHAPRSVAPLPVAHAMLVKAEVPSDMDATSPAAQPMLRNASTSHPHATYSHPRMMQARWQQTAQQQFQPNAEPEIEFTYAAVRVPDGWLIIRL